jgi:hypothetical protein
MYYKHGKIEFRSNNDSEGCIIFIPRHNSKSAFMKRGGDKRYRWVDSILARIGGKQKYNAKDTAQSLSYYLGRHHYESFLTAATQLMVPIHS